MMKELKFQKPYKLPHLPFIRSHLYLYTYIRIFCLCRLALSSHSVLKYLKELWNKSILHKLKGVLASDSFAYESHKSQIASHFRYLTKASRCYFSNLNQRFVLLCALLVSILACSCVCMYVFVSRVTASYGSIRF